MKLLPYYHSQSNNYYNRLIVEPIKIPEVVGANGLIEPSRELPGSACGIVYQVREGSDFKPGDEVQYMQVDRASFENMDTVDIEGKIYDVIYEHKIWAQNDKPYNKIFVLPVSQAEVGEGGLVIPTDVQSVTKKGVIYDAPEYFNLKKGDKVEYQNELGGFYPQCTIDDVLYDVLYDSDIFTINGEASPYRIIVKIDLVQQSFKRSTTQSGLKLSPLFIAMLRNLQYAEISDIGEKAKLMYPELSIGDTIIIDHGVESQDYRVISREYGKENNAIYEHRIINCYEFSDREIFGKLHYNKGTRKIIDITPLGDSIFMKWDFNMFDGRGDQKDSLLPDTEDTLSDYHNLSDLKNVVAHRRAEAAERAKLKMSGIKQTLAYLDPQLEPERYGLLAAEAQTIAMEETKIAARLRKDHWVVCERIFPSQVPRYVISPYEVLYPINILGHKYIIGHSDFLLFLTHTNMNIKSTDLVALSDNVLVLPVEEKEESSLIKIPKSARSKPQYGTVVKIGDSKDGVKEGDFILFRQGAGLVQQIDGVEHRIMKQNDLLAVLPKKD